MVHVDRIRKAPVLTKCLSQLVATVPRIREDENLNTLIRIKKIAQ